MESGLNSDTVQVEILPDEIAPSPVFVDSTGRRKRRFRTAGYLAGGLGMAYAAMLGLSFVGGPIGPGTLLPVPGMPESAVVNTGPEPEGSMSPISEGQLAREDGDKQVSRIGATSTPKPKTSGGATPKAGAVKPTPAKSSVAPSGTTAPTPPKTTPPANPTTAAPPPPPTPTAVPTTPPPSPSVDPPVTPSASVSGGGGGGAETPAPTTAIPTATTTGGTTAPASES